MGTEEGCKKPLTSKKRDSSGVCSCNNGGNVVKTNDKRVQQGRVRCSHKYWSFC